MSGSPSRDHSPSSIQHSFTRMPSLQYVNSTASLAGPPASIRTTSSIAQSPYLACSSIQCSPYPQQSTPQLPNPAPLELPESIIGPTTQPWSPPPGSKPESLIRKLSHGAKNAGHRLRRKASSQNQGRRDESSGPVARRRSDSKPSMPSSFTMDPEPSISEVSYEADMGLLISSIEGPLISNDDFVPFSEQIPDVSAPAIPLELLKGCKLFKYTRKKKQEKVLRLDVIESKVVWTGRLTTKSFRIDNIKSIRTDKDAISQWHAVWGEHLDPSCCFVINYASSEESNDIKTLHLMAPTKELAKLWSDTLHLLWKHRQELMTGLTGSGEQKVVLQALWDNETGKMPMTEAQLNQGGLDFNAIVSLCNRLHIHCPKSVILGAFEYADVRGIGLLTFDHFRTFVKRLRERTDIDPIFARLKEPSAPGISRDRFIQFLQDEQGIDISTDSSREFWAGRADQLIARSNHCRGDAQLSNSYIDFDAFVSFLASDACRIYSGTERTKTLLNRPINEYFISSSHNTYLLGRQVNGTSSVEAYISALRRGCRSVEIDCWDGDNDQPRVTHGFTKTTSVPFVEVIHAVNRSAFDVSPYPVTLSLEVHCNPIQQTRMVEIMKDVFGERLMLSLLPNKFSELPTPEELRHKILIKVKATEAYPNIHLTSDFSNGRKRSASSPSSRPIPPSSTSSYGPPGLSVPSPFMTSPPDSLSVYSPTDRSATATSASSSDESDAIIPFSSPIESNSKRVKTSKIIPTLASLGVYLQGYSFRGPFDLGFQQFNHIFSLNETTAVELCRTPDSKAQFEDHNLRHMCRVYPKNLRVNSSNFDPNTFWRRGVQMVALNYQTYDTHMQMNQAMFAAGSDQSGYVLKPEYLRKKRVTTGVFEHRLKLPCYKISFSVNVISAQQLPRLASMSRNDTVDPFIEVQMFSAEDKARGIAGGTGGESSSSVNAYHGIGSPYTRRTKVVRENGYNPQFNDLIDLNLETKYPELVFVRFIVYQSGKNSRQLAVFTSKLDSLQCGYRHIPLYNGHGDELIFSTLFCQITKRPPILMPSSLQDLADRTPRQKTFRTMLSRNGSGERGRELGMTPEDALLLRQRRVMQEIEERGLRR